MNNKAFIFDMEGVIIDSEPIHARAKMATLREYGITLSAQEIGLDKYVGRSAKSFWVDMKARFPEVFTEEWQVMAGKKYEKYMEILNNDATIKAIPGLPELLQRLKAKGYKIGLGSSSVRPMVNNVLTRFGIIEYFDALTTGDEVEHSKPDPTIYLLAAKKLGVNPADCTVVEDAASGVKAAKAAGMQCIAVRNPNSGQQDLSLADKIIDKYEEIHI